MMPQHMVRYPVSKLQGPLLRWALGHYELFQRHPELAAIKPNLRLLLSQYLLEREVGRMVEVPTQLLAKSKAGDSGIDLDLADVAE